MRFRELRSPAYTNEELSQQYSAMMDTYHDLAAQYRDILKKLNPPPTAEELRAKRSAELVQRYQDWSTQELYDRRAALTDIIKKMDADRASGLHFYMHEVSRRSRSMYYDQSRYLLRQDDERRRWESELNDIRAEIKRREEG